MSTLADIGEDALIRRLVELLPRDPAAAAGPGDDCALVPGAGGMLQVLKTDALVERVHFSAESPPRSVGWKAAARVVSDFAAMGGAVPERFLITLALPPSTQVAWVEQLYDGMGDCLRCYGGTLAGGETSAVPEGAVRVIVVAATGAIRPERTVLRSTARAGDVILVTGALGGSFVSGSHLSFRPRLAEAAWLAEHWKPTAMMDLSDGLAKDLPRLAAASGCGFLLERGRIPITPGHDLRAALNDGEDFELLLTCAPEQVAGLLESWSAAFPGLALTDVGRLTEPDAGEQLTGGWDHFG